MFKEYFSNLLWDMENEHMEAETENDDGVLKVTLAAEDSTNHIFHKGDEIRLAVNRGKYYLLDETNLMIPADICVNLNEDDAKKLSLLEAGFTVRKVNGNVIKAEIKAPYSLVHHGEEEWISLN